MALSTPVLLTSVSDDLAAEVVSSAVNIPQNNKCLAFVYNRNNNITNSISDTDGLTWTLEFESADKRIKYYSTTGSATSTSTVVTVTKTGPGHLHLIDIGNASLTPVQTKEITQIGGSNKTLTFDAAITAGNAFIGMVGHETGTATTSDNTELGNETAGPSVTVSAYATTGSTLSWTHSGTTSEVYGIEITEGADTTPDAFSFTDQTDITLSTPDVLSNTITVTGITGNTPVSLTSSDGMEYRINGGAWVTTAGAVDVNDTIQLRVTASSSYSTAVSGTLDVGGVTDTWSVTTEAAPDSTPDAFSFTDQTGIALSTPDVLSNTITVTGIAVDADITLTSSDGMEYRINGGAWVTAAGTVSLNDTVQLKVTASASYDTAVSGTLDIGGVTDVWSVTTVGLPSIDSADDNFTFGDTINFTTSDFGTITSRTLSDGTNTINLSGTDTTAVIPSLGDSVGVVLVGTVTFEVSDGTDTDSVSRTLIAPAGYSVVSLASGFDTGIYSWVYGWGNPAVVGTQGLFVTNDLTLYDTGLWVTPTQGTFGCYAIDPSDGIMQTFDLVTGPPPDVTVPVITLLGSDPVNINVNDPYTDAGATATDNVDGDITADIVTVNPVDNATPGQYTVTYNVQDSSGNDAVEVTRTVNVIDNGPPVITLLGSDPINLSYLDPYVDAGATAVDGIDGDLTNDIVVYNPVDTANIGQYIITYNVQDSDGNFATEVTRTINVSDTEPPVITLRGNAVETVEINTSYVDEGAIAVDDYDGIVTSNISTVNPVDTATVGQYTVTYNVQDASGNDAVEVTRTVNVVDYDIPVITLLGNSVENVALDGSYVDAGATASDSTDGDITADIVTVNPVDAATVGQYTVTYNVQDASGNDAVEVTRTVNVVDYDILRVGADPVLDVKYCNSEGTLVDVELQINGTTVWPIGS